LPNGIGTNGLPTSVQLVGRRFAEARVLQVGHIIESESDGTGGENT
jgi:Asp-tRNA(Asn)/Glu-tRNA(Gln) amidotransferase A subunit family amidase